MSNMRWDMDSTTVSAATSGTVAYGNDGTITINAPVLGSSITYESPSGVGVELKKSGEPKIGPKLYFKYVKSKLTKIQINKLKARMKKLRELVESAKELGQQALYEEYAKKLVVSVRESEAYVCGYTQYVTKEDLEKFRDLVRDEDNVKIACFQKLENYDRTVPPYEAKKIKSVKDKGLFDEIWILYLDYGVEKKPLKTNKEKIREKDPIVFGSYSYQPEKYYYILDYVDENCCLTLEEFVSTIGRPTQKTEDISAKFHKDVDILKKELEAQDIRLANTRPSNFRGLMAEEDKAKGKRVGWIRRLWNSLK